jgi:hypothetical protein
MVTTMSKTMLLVFTLIFIIASTAMGEVSVRVRLADDETSFLPVEVNLPVIEYPDIMVGTELSIILSSNVNGYWAGSLFIRGGDREYGVLSARDYNDVTLDWEGSHFPAVGKGSRVFDCEDINTSGFILYGHRDAISGDWFIIDYIATSVGECIVEFYDYRDPMPINMGYPTYEMVFFHVPTRDLNNDSIVNFWDYAQFATYWQIKDCNDPNTLTAIDLDANGDIDINDLILFSDYWLEKTR